MNAAVWLWLIVQVWQAPPSSLGEAGARESLRRLRMGAAHFQLSLEVRDDTPRQASAPVVPAPPLAAPPLAEHDEAWWRARVAAAREAVARGQLLLEAMASRIASLDTDIAARDDPAQRQALIEARAATTTERDRTMLQLSEAQRALSAILEEARKAGVPPGWVR